MLKLVAILYVSLALIVGFSSESSARPSHYQLGWCMDYYEITEHEKSAAAYMEWLNRMAVFTVKDTDEYLLEKDTDELTFKAHVKICEEGEWK